MSKIALITEAFPPANGGSSRWFFEIYRRLPRADVVVAAGEAPGAAAFDQAHDLRVVRLPLAMADLGLTRPANLAAYARLARRVRHIAREHGAQVLHCGRCLPDGWIAWLVRQLDGPPYACYVHGEEVELGPSRHASGIMSSRQMRWMARHVFRGAESLLANSLNTRRILIEQWGLPPERIHLFHPGVDTTTFRPAPRDDATRRSLGWGDRTVILTVGRLIPRKGHDHLIRALATIRRAVPDVLYAIVGDGEQRGPLLDLVEQGGLDDHVRFHGELDDEQTLRCYQQCDLFALPNRQVGRDIEGFGMVLLEAQACGRPVLAGNSGGTVETMAPGETGRVVPCDRPSELAASILDLLSDRDALERMGRAGRRWTVEHFDWEALGRRAAAIFDPLPPGGDQPALGAAELVRGVSHL